MGAAFIGAPHKLRQLELAVIKCKAQLRVWPATPGPARHRGREKQEDNLQHMLWNMLRYRVARQEEGLPDTAVRGVRHMIMTPSPVPVWGALPIGPGCGSRSLRLCLGSRAVVGARLSDS